MVLSPISPQQVVMDSPTAVGMRLSQPTVTGLRPGTPSTTVFSTMAMEVARSVTIPVAAEMSALVMITALIPPTPINSIQKTTALAMRVRSTSIG